MRNKRVSRSVAAAMFVGAACFGLLTAGAGSAAAGSPAGAEPIPFSSPEACQAAADQQNAQDPGDNFYFCDGSNLTGEAAG
jgi:hypothetical protein